MKWSRKEISPETFLPLHALSYSRIRVLKFWFAGSGRKWTGSATLHSGIHKPSTSILHHIPYLSRWTSCKNWLNAIVEYFKQEHYSYDNFTIAKGLLDLIWIMKENFFLIYLHFFCRTDTVPTYLCDIVKRFWWFLMIIWQKNHSIPTAPVSLYLVQWDTRTYFRIK